MVLPCQCSGARRAERSIVCWATLLAALVVVLSQGYARAEDEGAGAAFASDEEPPPAAAPLRVRKPLRTGAKPAATNDPAVRIKVAAPEGEAPAPENLDPPPADPERVPVVVEAPAAAEEMPLEEEPAPAAEPPTERAADTTTIEPAMLNGIQPGVSTVADVKRQWGNPLRILNQETSAQHVFEMPPFQQVTVSYAGTKVASLMVDLGDPFSADDLAREMELDWVRPAPVSDETGAVLGLAYPERAVLFRYVADKPGLVDKIILETITADTFLQRADATWQSRPSDAARDLAQALKLEPQNAAALGLKARWLYMAGQMSEAAAVAEQAVASDGENMEYLLTWAEAKAADEPGAVVEKLTEMIDTADDQPMTVQARAWLIQGDLTAAWGRDFRQASEQHMNAIKLAKSAATANSPLPLRQSARELLLRGHLALARDVALGNWKNKQAVTDKWLKAAMDVAEADEMPNSDTWKFRVAAGALGAYASLEGDVDPRPWSDLVQTEGERLIAAAEDPLARQMLQRDLAAALYDGVRAYQALGQYGVALTLAQKALEHLEQATAQRNPNGSESYLFGQLMFRAGVIQAIDRANHKDALAWFNEALPMVDVQLKGLPAVDVGQQGEMLVSMAISFWETGNKQRALELTTSGVERIERAVRKGLLSQEALGVPYRNLAFMHRNLGQADVASRLEQKANSLGLRR